MTCSFIVKKPAKKITRPHLSHCFMEQQNNWFQCGRTLKSFLRKRFRTWLEQVVIARIVASFRCFLKSQRFLCFFCFQQLFWLYRLITGRSPAGPNGRGPVQSGRAELSPRRTSPGVHLFHCVKNSARLWVHTAVSLLQHCCSANNSAVKKKGGVGDSGGCPAVCVCTLQSN